jgi:hypoxanthine phosphoribosyltransferase
MSQESESVPREVLTWPLFGTATRELATQIAESGYHPQLILTMARGGLVPSGALAYALSVKNIAVINVEYYVGINERLDFPVILPSPLSEVDLTASRVLIVDDVADTGATLDAIFRHIAHRTGEVRTAVIYEKPESTVKCDYVWRRTDRWIDFPWSDQPPVMDREGKMVVGDAQGH